MHTTDTLVMNSFREITNITQKCFQWNAESNIKPAFVASLTVLQSPRIAASAEPSPNTAHITLAALPAQG